VISARAHSRGEGGTESVSRRESPLFARSTQMELKAPIVPAGHSTMAGHAGSTALARVGTCHADDCRRHAVSKAAHSPGASGHTGDTARSAPTATAMCRPSNHPAGRWIGVDRPVQPIGSTFVRRRP